MKCCSCDDGVSHTDSDIYSCYRLKRRRCDLLSKDRVLGIVIVVLTALIMVTKAIQADAVLDCADEYET